MPPSPPLSTDLLERIRRIAPLAESHARDAERDRTLHPHVALAMKQEGLFAISAPREVGGLDADVETQLVAFERAAHADAAAGWCLMIGALTTAMMGALLPDRAVERIFASGVHRAARPPLRASGQSLERTSPTLPQIS